jgi:amidase
MKKLKQVALFAAVLVLAPATQANDTPDAPSEIDINVEEQSIENLATYFKAGTYTSEEITAAYLERIARFDDANNMLNAVIAVMPDALEQARAMDAERKAGKYRGPMHGIPVLLKDNIEAAGPIPTTAGSLALKDNITNRDAPLVARLRDAGAVILGKTNLSEWANIRSNNSTSGWSAVGGLTKNPYALDRNACGSSSGSGSAIAASFAAAAVGTETDGSIVCPSGINGLVGFKPTVGLISRRFVVPISHSQDTAGPMTRSVKDAAIMLTAMAGSDPEDSATLEADKWRGNYAAGLDIAAIKGMRIGVLRAPDVSAAQFDAAIATLKAAGAELIPIDTKFIDEEKLGNAEFKVLKAELKADLAAYLQGLPSGLVPHKTLADIIAFNKANAATELQYFDQGIFEAAEKEAGLDDPAYIAARATSLGLAGGGLDRLFFRNKLDVIIAQTNGRAWLSTLGKGDAFSGPSASTLPAVAGYPHLTVPMGLDAGLPVGLSFIGAKWHDHAVLKAGYAYEQLSKARVAPTYAGTIEPETVKSVKP